MQLPRTLLFAAAAMVTMACSYSPTGGAEAPPADSHNVTLGIVRYVDLEGGFYGVITDDGVHHNPVNLHGDFQVDGLRISYTYKTIENIVGIQMWGTPVEILEIQKRLPEK